MTGGMENQVVQLDGALAEAEKQAKALLGRIRGMRKRAVVGEFSPLSALFEQLPPHVAQIVASAQAAREALVYDTATALSDGRYLAELQAEAEKQGVVLIERDGRLSAFPLLLKLDPKSPGIRIGRAMERRLRPSTVIRMLAKAQATTKFDAATFVDQLFDAYSYLAPVSNTAWRPKASGDGPAIPLNDIYAVLTILPAAAAEYPREAFASNLLRLDRVPDARTSTGHRFTLPASTGSKGSKRLTVYDEEGIERMFVAIRFSMSV